MFNQSGRCQFNLTRHSWNTQSAKFIFRRFKPDKFTISFIRFTYACTSTHLNTRCRSVFEWKKLKIICHRSLLATLLNYVRLMQPQPIKIFFLFNKWRTHYLAFCWQYPIFLLLRLIWNYPSLLYSGTSNRWDVASAVANSDFFMKVTPRGQGGGSLYVDNIAVSTVPLPAAAWLFISAIAGLAGAKRLSCSKRTA